MYIPTSYGPEFERSAILAAIRQFGTDITRLWRRVAELPQTAGQGTGDGSAYNTSQQYTKYARLTDFCHAGTPAVRAIEQQYTEGMGYADNTDPGVGSLLVNGYFMAGYGFADEIVEVRFDIPSQMWLVDDNGHHLVRGSLAGTLNSAGSATVNLARGGTVTGYEVLGTATPIPAGKNVWLCWNIDTKHWEVVSAQC